MRGKELCEGDSVTINGIDYYSSTGIYIDTVAAFNCDSVVTLDLTVPALPTGSESKRIMRRR